MVRRKTTTRKKRAPRKSMKGRKKRRATSTRRRRRVMTPISPAPAARTDVKQSLAIYNNPFSKSLGVSKILDGKAITSVGTRVQVAKEFVNDTPTNGNVTGILHMLVYPGVTQGLVVWGDESDYGTRGFTACKYNDHSTLDMTDVYNDGTLKSGNIVLNDKMNRWRIVSQGLKINLLNTSEENDGFWEAIRLTDRHQCNEFGFYSGDNTDQQTNVVYGPDHSMLARLNGKDMVNSPTYVSGSLKEINEVTFELQPQTNDHDFNFLNSQYAVTNTDVNLISGQNRYLSMVSDSPQNQLMHKALVDRSYDSMYIRIHCRANDGSNSFGSRIHAHLIGNMEVCYDEDQPEHKFMTRSEPAHAAFAEANEKKRKFSNMLGS